MKARGWLLAIVVVVGVVVVRGGCLNSSSKAPDERLAANLVDLCEIARSNVDSPEKGVKKLGRYLGKHADDMLGAFGASLAAVERIDDDERHDARARLVRERISAPMRACERDWERFFRAVEGDEAASALLQRGLDRLGRTLEIIFSSEQPLRLRDLPKQLTASGLR